MDNNLFNKPESQRLVDIFTDMADLDSILEENGGELTPELEALLAENEAALAAKIDGYNYAVKAEKAAAAAIAEEIKRLQALKKTHENAEKRIREYLAWNMERVGANRVDGAYCKAYFSKNVSVQVDDEAALRPYVRPMEIFRDSLPPYIKVSLSIDKTILKGVLDAGAEVDGACIVPGKSLTIK